MVMLHEQSNNLLGKFQKLQERALTICIKPNAHTPAPILERTAAIACLEKRRLCHVYNFMYKQKLHVHRLDLIKIYTRRRDATIFKTGKPNCGFI